MKKVVYWILAIVITLALSIYQRMTGPTYPKKVTIEVRGERYQIKLPRSGVQQDEVITLKGVPEALRQAQGPVAEPVEAPQLHYRRYPTTISSGRMVPGRQLCQFSPSQASCSIISRSTGRTI